MQKKKKKNSTTMQNALKTSNTYGETRVKTKKAKSSEKARLSIDEQRTY